VPRPPHPSPDLPQTGFLFSIAGLSVTLVGFSGLIAALSRDGQRPAIIAYRLRQIPEMALASALLALISLPLYDATHSATTTIRVGSALAFAFTAVHVGLLIHRTRTQTFRLGHGTWIFASLIDASLFAVAIIGFATATEAAYEWLLVFMVSRPAIAFVMALNDVMGR
jgi:hypothetical protein